MVGLPGLRVAAMRGPARRLPAGVAGQALGRPWAGRPAREDCVLQAARGQHHKVGSLAARRRPVCSALNPNPNPLGAAEPS